MRAKCTHGLAFELAQELIEQIEAGEDTRSLVKREIKSLYADIGLEYKRVQEGGAEGTRTKAKRSTAGGDAEAKLKAALTHHHDYSKRSVLNENPVGVNDLARLAEVSKSTASEFFGKYFKNHCTYKADCRTGKLLLVLTVMNDDFQPDGSYGSDPDTKQG